MIVLIFALFGVILGIILATRRKGNAFDKAQYATVLAIFFGMIGLLVSLGITYYE